MFPFKEVFTLFLEAVWFFCSQQNYLAALGAYRVQVEMRAELKAVGHSVFQRRFIMFYKFSRSKIKMKLLLHLKIFDL